MNTHAVSWWLIMHQDRALCIMSSHDELWNLMRHQYHTSFLSQLSICFQQYFLACVCVVFRHQMFEGNVDIGLDASDEQQSWRKHNLRSNTPTKLLLLNLAFRSRFLLAGRWVTLWCSYTALIAFNLLSYFWVPGKMGVAIPFDKLVLEMFEISFPSYFGKQLGCNLSKKDY